MLAYFRLAAGGFLFAFIVFPLPALRPKVYWLTHSLWHAGCAFAYYELYCALDGVAPFYVSATLNALSSRPAAKHAAAHLLRAASKQH